MLTSVKNRFNSFNKKISVQFALSFLQDRKVLQSEVVSLHASAADVNQRLLFNALQRAGGGFRTYGPRNLNHSGCIYSYSQRIAGFTIGGFGLCTWTSCLTFLLMKTSWVSLAIFSLQDDDVKHPLTSEFCQPVSWSMPAVLHDFVAFVVVMRTCPRAIPLAITTMRKCQFSAFLFSFLSIGRSVGAPQKIDGNYSFKESIH